MALDLEPSYRGEQPGSVLVVFLHGLNSSGETWTRDGQNWRDLLLTDTDYRLKDVDVAVATYKSFLWNSKITQTIRKGVMAGVQKILMETPEMPGMNSGNPSTIPQLSSNLKHELEMYDYSTYNKIILVGHSMGGLIGIHYLLQSVRRGTSKVVGYVSLATPFNGSELANFKDFASGYTQEQIDALMTNSDFLDSVKREWVAFDKEGRLNGIHFRSFYGEDDRIVSPNSAIPEVVSDKWADAIGLAGGHSEVLRVQDHKSKPYRMVKDLIIRALSAPSASPTPPTAPTGEGWGAEWPTTGTTNSTTSSRLSTHQHRMKSFVQAFPMAMRPDVQQAAEHVEAELERLAEDQLQRFFARYCFPFQHGRGLDQGLGVLWETLTLLHFADPSWNFHDANEVANLRLRGLNVWKRLIHSVNHETMPVILLALTRLRLDGPEGADIEDSELKLFPHRVILDNTRPIARYSRCRHCKPETPYPFHNLLIDCTEDENAEVFEGVTEGSNTYRKLESTEVCCTVCLQNKALQAAHLAELQQTVRDVI